MPASAQSNSGQFNPQTQFPIGTKLQITSVYGLETLPPPIPTFNPSGFNHTSHTWGNNSLSGNHTQISRNDQSNRQWNLTYLRNVPTTNSSISINVEVTNQTEDGGVMWIVQGGTIAYNGTTITVTGGIGGIGKLDRVLMIGNATDSNGNTVRWSLEGLATLYSGTVIVSLTGTIGQLRQKTPHAAPAGPNEPLTPVRGISLTYIATIS